LQYAVGKIAGYLFMTVGFYVALKLVGIDLSSLAVVAGAIGVGLGFGLQDIINNFVSGLIILAERPISIGDRVELGEVAGLVTRINLHSTNIVTNDNITIIVPNYPTRTSLPTKSPTGVMAIPKYASDCRSGWPTAPIRNG
jgi:small-conductance mechanosensitive channel